VEFICWTRLPGQVFGDVPDAHDLCSLLIKWTVGLECHTDRDAEWQLKMKCIALFTLLRDLTPHQGPNDLP
jgi:hypothetical protein